MNNNFISLLRGKKPRILVTFVTMTIFVILAIGNIEYTFSHDTAKRSFLLPIGVSLGVSLFIALIFLLVGTLVWIYARDRNVAFLLSAFCYSSMIPFELETASLLNPLSQSWITLLSDLASAFVIFLLAVLLLVFPKNYFTYLKSPYGKHVRKSFMRGLRSIPFLHIYTAGLFILFCATTISTLFKYFNPSTSIPIWLLVSNTLGNGILLISSIITVVISFQRSSKRERAQLRFFTSGIILAFVPLLLLTVLPVIIGLPSVDAQITVLTVALLPLSLGYSILRYQLLVFDTYICKTVKWLLGIIFLAILAYIGILVGDWSKTTGIFSSIAVAGTIAVLAPVFWWLAQVVTERVLFRESLYYRRLLNEPIKLVDEALSLEHVAQLITVAAIQALETPQVCLFVFSEETGCYHIAPTLTENQQDIARHSLMQRLLSSPRLLTPIPSLPDAIALHAFVEERLSIARRPLLAYEVIRREGETPIGLERYLTSPSPDERNDMLLAPIRAQGEMIGILVLGERGDDQSYAGPDFELVELLLARFASLLETARLQERSRHYTTMLNSLYQVNAVLTDESQTLASVATAYATVAATSLNARVELWTSQHGAENRPHALRPLIALGEGPRLSISKESTLLPHEEDWIPVFSSGKSVHDTHSSLSIPSCLSPMPVFPFAWLPLKEKNGRHLGVLLLTYGRPHQFLKDEIRLLEMFADQCAASLENTSVAMELRAAYERQKELDLLKDQFIMTASHELRTPLTAVLGYLELLTQYHTTLNEETRADFIEKAHRGCDELMLMVNNIMDANQMQFTLDKPRMETISLFDAVIYIVEMLDSMAKREQRNVSVSIPKGLFVEANTIRLHQVLLNLLSNAFKYSPSGTPIEIYARVEDGLIETCIRDYGAGVPEEERQHLFERFVRLERDLNSPIRGTGLGLYICKQLIEAMDGSIWVESSGQEGEGSIFIFTLHQALIVSQEISQNQSFIHGDLLLQ